MASTWKKIIIGVIFITVALFALDLFFGLETIFTPLRAYYYSQETIEEFIVDLPCRNNITFPPPESEQYQHWKPTITNETRWIGFLWPGYGGRHHNQVIAMMKTLWLATQTNRGLVMLRFFQGRWHHASEFYDLDRLGRALQLPVIDHQNWVSLFPQQTLPTPEGVSVYEIERTVENIRARSDHTVLIEASSLFYSRIPFEKWEPLFEHLWPSGGVAAAVNWFLQSRLTNPYTAVHVRWLEGNCGGMVSGYVLCC
jgi:hypothetical protein